MSGHYDVLWKGMLECVCEDLLRFIFPDAERYLDLRRGVEFLDKELNAMYPGPGKKMQTRLVDKLVKLYLKDGSERWILLHVEVQQGKDKDFARRMFTYYYKILAKYNRPVTAIVLYTGLDGKKMPDRYEDHFMGTRVLYQYNTLFITDYPDELLKASDNPFATVLLAAKTGLVRLVDAKTDEEFDRALLRQKLLVVKHLHEKGIFSEQKIAAIVTFVNNYVQFKKPETIRTFDELVDGITGKKNTMNIFEQLAEIKAEEARKETRKEARKELKAAHEQSVKAFLQNTEFSVEKIASLVGVSVSFAMRVRDSLKKG